MYGGEHSNPIKITIGPLPRASSSAQPAWERDQSPPKWLILHTGLTPQQEPGRRVFFMARPCGRVTGSHWLLLPWRLESTGAAMTLCPPGSLLTLGYTGLAPHSHGVPQHPTASSTRLQHVSPLLSPRISTLCSLTTTPRGAHTFL